MANKNEEWVFVGDALPDKNDNNDAYLVYCSDGTMEVAWRGFKRDGWYFQDGHADLDVLYWRNLPKEPNK